MLNFNKYIKILESVDSDDDLTQLEIDFLTAAKEGNISVLKDCIKDGVNLEVKDYQKYTAINSCATYGYYNCVKYLLDIGAKIETKDISGYTPLNNAANKANYKIVELLIKYGANVNTKDNSGDTPLHNSLMDKFDIEVIKILIKSGADINIKNDRKKTPIDYNKDTIWSKKEIQKELIKQNPFNITLLKKHGVEIHTDIKKQYDDLDLGSDLGTI